MTNCAKGMVKMTVDRWLGRRSMKEVEVKGRGEGVRLKKGGVVDRFC